MGRDVVLINDAIDHIRRHHDDEAAAVTMARLIAVRDNLCASPGCADRCPVGCLGKSGVDSRS